MRATLWGGGLLVILGLCALAVALGRCAGPWRGSRWVLGVGDANAIAILRAIRLPRLTLA